MAPQIPSLKLRNGQEIPQVGLGTWKSQPGEVGAAVKDAIDVGYRHFDCALAYGNEAEIGAALEQKIKEGAVTREELFITSKVWNTFHSSKLARECVNKSLQDLRTPYLDLCLIHWPMGYLEGKAMVPKNEEGARLYSDVDYLETWKTLEDLVEEGKIKSIGVSNFNSEQIQRLMNEGKIKPAVCQVECHPYLTQTKLLKFCKNNDIVFTSYSSLGSKDRPPHMKIENEPVLLEDPNLQKIASKHGKSIAQILLRFQIQRGVVVIPKSVNRSRMEQNLQLFDFELTEEEMATVEGFNINFRYCVMAWDSGHKYYPFNIEF